MQMAMLIIYDFFVVFHQKMKNMKNKKKGCLNIKVL